MDAEAENPEGRRASVRTTTTAGAPHRGTALRLQSSCRSQDLSPVRHLRYGACSGRIAPHYQEAFTPVPSPLITYTRQGAALRMEWAAAGFVLEQNTDLANPSGWMDVPGGDVGHVII